jgi:hypothetical protein
MAAARHADGERSMSKGSEDPELMALKAALRVLIRAVAEHYESEIGFRSQLRRRAALMIDQEPLEGGEAAAAETRARAKEALGRLFSDSPSS